MNENQVVEKVKALLLEKEICSKCSGSGWVWREELDRQEYDNDYFCDDTKYTCDRCLGYGMVEAS